MSIRKFREVLETHSVDAAVVARMMEGYEGISHRCKNRRPAFFVHAMQVMDETLDFPTRCAVRGACTCSNGGWREKEMRRIARACKGRSLEARIQAMGQVQYMGSPVLHEGGTISGGVGTEGGFDCPCPMSWGWQYEEPVSPTYCLCCAAHFRHHYQIALGVKLRVKAVLSTALQSQRQKPFRFLYEVE